MPTYLNPLERLYGYEEERAERQEGCPDWSTLYRPSKCGREAKGRGLCPAPLPVGNQTVSSQKTTWAELREARGNPTAEPRSNGFLDFLTEKRKGTRKPRVKAAEGQAEGCRRPRPRRNWSPHKNARKGRQDGMGSLAIPDVGW